MRKFLATTALALVMSTGAQAESDMSAFLDKPASGNMLGTEFIGMRLYTAEVENDEFEGARVSEERLMVNDAEREWDDIGEVNDVLLSRDGKVTAVLVDIGGFLGLGEKTVAVSMDQIKFVSENDEGEGEYFLVINSTEEALESAPEFDKAMFDGDIMDNEQVENDQTANVDVDMNEIESETEQAAANLEATGEQIEAETEQAAAEVETEMEQAEAELEADPNNPFRDFRVDGYTSVNHRDMTADDLDGARVYGINDEDVGEISDLVLTQDGQVEKAIIDVGGFLGIGERSVAVGFDKLSIQKENDGAGIRIYIDATEESLEELPEHDG